MASVLDSHVEKDDLTCFVGVDEAGYGPNLGPLVLASTSFFGPASLDNENWWKALRPAVGRYGTKRGLPIDDSKKILGSPNGREKLNAVVPLILKFCGMEGMRLDELCDSLAPIDRSSLQGEHWYCPLRDGRMSEIPDETALPPTIRPRLLKAMANIRIGFGRPCARIHFPPAFNDGIERASNKASVEVELIKDLLTTTIGNVPAHCRRIIISVDRLGGRRYYRAIVEDLCQSLVMTLGESPHWSAYRFHTGEREIEIRFVVKGDRHHLPSALASMIAKYLRERCMEQFNDFWQGHVPDVKPTAGYHTDAHRFLDDIRPHLERLAIPMNAFWRSR